MESNTSARSGFSASAWGGGGQFLDDAARLRCGKIDLIDDRDDREIVLHGQVNVGQRLRLDALGRIDHQQRALARSQRTGDFIGEVHVPRGIYQVDLVLAPIVVKAHANSLRLDGDAALAFEAHGIEQLSLHVARGDSARNLEHAVGKRRFPMVYMGDDAEIADERGIHSVDSTSP